MTTAENDQRLTRSEISTLVHRWIGVDGGYLGRFTYRSHDQFWLEACELEIDTTDYPGTCRECFEATLREASARDQAAALRLVLEEYPPLDEPDPSDPRFRTPALHQKIRSWIGRLETGQVVVEIDTLLSHSDVVRRALDDANTLLRTSGAQSAVDRLHTAMHGYLRSACAQADLSFPDRPTMNQLLKLLRKEHPAFKAQGPRADDIDRVLLALATILDALNPLRNNASVAHPTDELLEEPEAALVVNTVRTLLAYLDGRLAMADQRDHVDIAAPI